MTLLHTADWHLGNTFHGHSREEEHAHFLGWLLETLRQRQPDALLITGDVFDSPNPSATAEEMFFRFLHDATCAVEGLQIVVTAGNHDSGSRLEAPAALLKSHNIYVRGTLRLTDKGEPDYDHYLLPLSSRQQREAEMVVFALPYLRSGDYPASLSQEEGLRSFFDHLYKHLRRSDFHGLPVVVGAHFYAAGAEINDAEHSERLVVGGQDKVEAAVAGKQASYVALGHIHKSQQVAENTWYAGSALPMSFSEKHYRHGALWVEIEGDGAAAVSHLDYAPPRPLLSIPDRGAALAADVLDALAQLPQRRPGDEGLTWPYLELRVRERQPEPQLLHQVTEALQDRAVHFCRMVREVPGEKSQPAAESLETLQGLAPIEMARRVFRNRYSEEMPAALTERFLQALEEVGKA